MNVDFLYDSEYVDDADDLVFLSERVVKGIEKVPCILIEFLGKKGALVTPKSQQLIFNREDTDLPFSYKSANVIEADNTIIFHDVKADLGFNSSSAEHGMLAPLWKSALKQMYKTNYRYL